VIKLAKGRAIYLSRRRSIKFQNDTLDNCWNCNRNLSFQIVSNNSGRLRCLSCSLLFNVFSEVQKLEELINLLKTSKSFEMKKKALEADEIITNSKGEIIAVR
jgi:hypothetical protein